MGQESRQSAYITPYLFVSVFVRGATPSLPSFGVVAFLFLVTLAPTVFWQHHQEEMRKAPSFAGSVRFHYDALFLSLFSLSLTHTHTLPVSYL